jgi:hypothetical protein
MAANNSKVHLSGMPFQIYFTFFALYNDSHAREGQVWGYARFLINDGGEVVTDF